MGNPANRIKWLQLPVNIMIYIYIGNPAKQNEAFTTGVYCLKKIFDRFELLTGLLLSTSKVIQDRSIWKQYF